MNSEKTGKPSIRNIYNETFKAFKNNPSILLPFIIFAISELVALFFIYLAPRAPLMVVLGPPIRTFWGERFLHYPANFLLFPKLTYLAKLGLTVALGSLFTGAAVSMIGDTYRKKEINLLRVFKTAGKKYISLFGVVFILALILYIAGRIIALGKIETVPVLIGINFVVSVFIQAGFIYAIPLVMLKDEKLTKSILGSLVLFKRLCFRTLVLVGLPMCLLIPITVLGHNTPFLINRFFPEVILLVSFLDIIVSSLLIDPLVSVSATILYLAADE